MSEAAAPEASFPLGVWFESVPVTMSGVTIRRLSTASRSPLCRPVSALAEGDPAELLVAPEEDERAIAPDRSTQVDPAPEVVEAVASQLREGDALLVLSQLLAGVATVLDESMEVTARYAAANQLVLDVDLLWDLISG